MNPFIYDEPVKISKTIFHAAFRLYGLDSQRIRGSCAGLVFS